ncbi:MAG: hypothetical protein AAB545_02270 [Patescibacteria group bacterium]
MDFLKQEGKNIVLFIALLLGAFLVWKYYFADNTVDEGALLTTQNVILSGAEGEVLRALIDIKKIKIDDSIFSSTVFRSLEKFGRDISPEPKGRFNPFAPATDAAPVSQGNLNIIINDDF